MKWPEENSAEDDLITQVRAGSVQQASRPNFLYIVTAGEIANLRLAIARRELPPDFEAKLGRLAEGDLTQRFVERTCRLFAALVLAVQDEKFAAASKSDCERLLRVLAYVRKDDDVVADYKPNGFLDDQQEVRAAMADLGPLLKTFKTWRLRHQVPGLWLKAA
jgi:hypothetical protein